MHSFVLACENISALDLDGYFNFMCVGLTAAVGSCSNSWHVMWCHSACVCMFVCLAHV